MSIMSIFTCRNNFNFNCCKKIKQNNNNENQTLEQNNNNENQIFEQNLDNFKNEIDTFINKYCNISLYSLRIYYSDSNDLYYNYIKNLLNEFDKYSVYFQENEINNFINNLINYLEIIEYYFNIHKDALIKDQYDKKFIKLSKKIYDYLNDKYDNKITLYKHKPLNILNED